jgi:hypothetical protein
MSVGGGRAATGGVPLPTGRVAKVRSFSVGLLLAILTLGIYLYFWWYAINDELRGVGVAKGDQSLAESRPGNSVLALTLGGLVFVPPLISVYNTSARIQRAQRLCGIPAQETINPTLSLLLLVPGGLLLVPTFVHYWYMTKHQNSVVRAAAGQPAWG